MFYNDRVLPTIIFLRGTNAYFFGAPRRYRVGGLCAAARACPLRCALRERLWRPLPSLALVRQRSCRLIVGCANVLIGLTSYQLKDAECQKKKQSNEACILR